MPDTLGRVTVPTPYASALVFPFISDYPAGMTRDWPVVEHRFGDEATLAVQRFQVGIGPRRFQFQRAKLSRTDRQSLIDFWNGVQGSFQSFLYNVPNPDGTTTQYRVIFETKPLSITDLANSCTVGLTFVESIDPSAAPTYNVNNVSLRFPNAILEPALLDQVQQIIPLVHISVRNSLSAGNPAGVPDIWLSDRRAIFDGIPGAPAGPVTYLPRLVGIGEAGSDALITQDISGRADNVKFTFGNADRAMSALVQDCSIQYATIDLCLYHVQSQSLLQLWKGIILSWNLDQSANFTVSCSDGLYPVTQKYPARVISRQCWKPFNTQIFPGYTPCPYDTMSSNHGGDATSCDYFFDTANGCLAHGMSPYFGGHPEFPQSVVIKDDGTGILNGLFGRNTVTSTSIASDSMYGQPLPEIWCNNGTAIVNSAGTLLGYADNGDPLKCFIANTIVAAVRDESTFMDVLGIVGVGPIGEFGIDDPRPGGPVTSVSNGLPVPPGQGGVVAIDPDGLPILVAPIADGFPPQGFKVNTTNPANIYSQESDPTKNSDLGLRQIHGEDPVLHTQVFVGGPQYAAGSFSLGQGSPQRWDVPDPPYPGGGGFSNIDTGAANDILPMAAGTAFAEMRYSKSATGGIAPTTAESHVMSVPIAKGLSGISDLSGTVTPGLINPFWVAVNTYLRALGIDQAPFSIQQNYFVGSSLYVGDGSGAAEIADAQVPPLVGDPTQLETQFVFQGTLTEFKPFRDWLTEILACALGYYTFEFGQLKLGCRENAGAVSTFTLGNMLYRSLMLTPVAAAFEDLRIDFANVAYQYQADMVEYTDKDHAQYFNRVSSPLSSRQRIVGLSTTSQGLRLAATRVREEIGGILRPDLPNPYAEWDNAFTATFKTTILALETEVGEVISITHPDVPTYPGPPSLGMSPNGAPPSYEPPSFTLRPNTWNYRIQRWTLHRDWSITIQAKSVTDSMYQLDYGPKPIDATPPALPVLYYPEPLGEWAPYNAQGEAGDALFPGELTFELQLQFSPLADGTQLAQAIATGAFPVDSFVPGVGAPGVTLGGIIQSATGGQLAGGKTYRISIACNVQVPGTSTSTTGTIAIDTALNLSGSTPPSQILTIPVPAGANTNSIKISDIQWPAFPNIVSATIYASDQDDLICSQATIPLTADGTGTAYSPTSVTLGASADRTGWGVPNPVIQKVRIKGKPLIHGGAIGAQITSVSGNQIVSNETVDVTGIDQWRGRFLIPIGRQPSAAANNPSGITTAMIPFESYNVIAFSPDTGTFVLDRDASALQPGDAFIVTTQSPDNSANPYKISDPALSNALNYSLNGAGAMLPGTLAGNPINGATMTIGGNTYVFQNIVSIANGVQIGATINATLNNLATVLNITLAPSAGVTASVSADQITLTAATSGAAGNDLAASGVITWANSGNFAGGVDPGTPTPHTGLTPNLEIGNIIRVIAGTSRGKTAKIIANDATSYTVDPSTPLRVDPTSVWIVEGPSWTYSSDSASTPNGTPQTMTSIALGVDNFIRQSLLIGGFTVDQGGVEAPDGDAPVRMLYVFSAALQAGTPNFTAHVDGGAMLTVRDFKLSSIVAAGTVREVDFTPLVIDETDMLFGSATMNATTDPVTGASPAITNMSRLVTNFTSGDFIQWLDNYEIDQILIDPKTGLWTFNRQPDPVNYPGVAQFGSVMAAHAGTFMRAMRGRKYNQPGQQNSVATVAPATNSGFQENYEWAVANKCVGAVTCQILGNSNQQKLAQNPNSPIVQLGPTQTLNLASVGLASSPECPGLRSMNGGSYKGVIAWGALSVGMVAQTRLSVDEWHSIRCITAECDDGPVGADLIVWAVYIPNDKLTAYVADKLVIPDGDTRNYLTGNDPSTRMMPYHVGWSAYRPSVLGASDFPPNLLPQITNPFDGSGKLQLTGGTLTVNPSTYAQYAFGGYMDLLVQQVGSTTAGSTLKLVWYT